MTMRVSRLPLAAAAFAIAVALPLAATAQGVDDKTDRPSDRARQSALSADIMYRVLVGDIALQRGEPAVAARAYLEAAREARDPALARRATEIAVASRQRAYALEAANLWSELDPQAERPKQLASALASGNAGKLLDTPADNNELLAALERALEGKAPVDLPKG
jgi:hypothetical protein